MIAIIIVYSILWCFSLITLSASLLMLTCVETTKAVGWWIVGSFIVFSLSSYGITRLFMNAAGS